MIEFTGYIEHDISPRNNDVLNLFNFLRDVQHFYHDLWENESYGLSANLTDSFYQSYQNLMGDLKKSIIETDDIVNEELVVLEVWPQSRRGKFWFLSWQELLRVGLTGMSLKLKLDNNKAAWAEFTQNRKTNNQLEKDERDDFISLFSLVKSILSSLSSAWGLGEAVKELIDVIESIFSRLISLSGN